MKKIIYARTRAFRSTPLLDQSLLALSETTNRNESELIREAVWKFCSYYKDRPTEILKPI